MTKGSPLRYLKGQGSRVFREGGQAYDYLKSTTDDRPVKPKAIKEQRKKGWTEDRENILPNANPRKKTRLPIWQEVLKKLAGCFPNSGRSTSPTHDRCKERCGRLTTTENETFGKAQKNMCLESGNWRLGCAYDDKHKEKRSNTPSINVRERDRKLAKKRDPS